MMVIIPGHVSAICSLSISLSTDFRLQINKYMFGREMNSFIKTVCPVSFLSVCLSCFNNSAGWIAKKSNVRLGVAGRTHHSIKYWKYNGKVIPVIIETGGHFDKAGRGFIDKLARSQQDAPILAIHATDLDACRKSALSGTQQPWDSTTS